jgi:hypothetical protein
VECEQTWGREFLCERRSRGGFARGLHRSGPHLLPRAEVQKLIAARPRSGASCPGEHLELPVAAESAGGRLVLVRQGLKWAVE